MQLSNLIAVLESTIASEKRDAVQKAYADNAHDETVTASEQSAHWVTDLPAPHQFRAWNADYNAAQNAVPEHSHREGWSSWQCCTEHRSLNYANYLLRTVAYAYSVQSERQPLSEQWWQDFEAQFK